jgi:hypothetical protein
VDKKDIENRRYELRSLLFDLSKSQIALKTNREKSEIYKRLEHIYYYNKDEKFRHFYSDIYAALSLIDKDQSIGDLEILGQNLDIIMKNYEPDQNMDEDGNAINIADEIFKLYDHVNLDIARLTALRETGNKNKIEQRRMDGLVSDIEKKYKKLEDTIPDIKDMQKSYISILGIFASIVLSFTAGMAFSNSVLDNIYKASIYRTVIVASLVGIVFIAMIWLLLDFIRNIQGQHKRNWWYIVVPETLLTLMIIFSSIAYKCDWFSGEEKITHSIYENNTEYEEYDSIE